MLLQMIMISVLVGFVAGGAVWFGWDLAVALRARKLAKLEEEARAESDQEEEKKEEEQEEEKQQEGENVKTGTREEDAPDDE